MKGKENLPLVVDLDGTLIAADSMIEACAWLWKNRPWKMISLVLCELIWSRARFKWALYKLVPTSEIGQRIPFNEPLVEWLKKQKSEGRKIILMSATPQFWVDEMGEITKEKFGNGIFDEYVGSTRTQNRRAGKKAKFLVKRFGRNGFDYIGNGQADIPVWHAARVAYNVNPSRRLIAAARGCGVELAQVAENPQCRTMEAWDDWVRVWRRLRWFFLIAIAALLFCGGLRR
jgi:phosphoserine phosphatase